MRCTTRWFMVLGMMLATPAFAQTETETKEAVAEKQTDEKQEKGSSENSGATEEERLEQFAAIEKELMDGIRTYSTKSRAAQSEIKDKKELRAELNKIRAEHYPDRAEFVGRMLELGEANPSDEAGEKAFTWILSNDRNSKASRTALKMLKKHHIDSKAMANVAMSLVYSPSKANKTFLQELIENSPHDSVKGISSFALAQQMKRAMRANPETEAEVLALLENVVSKYGDTKYRNQALKDMASADLFELKFLSVGKEAPEIAAEDIDGIDFKLSDYRGKIVFLDFWGDW